MKLENIIFEKIDRVGLIRLNRPNQLNALCDQLIDELNLVLDNLESDDNISVAILTGSEKVFAAGADVNKSSDDGETPLEVACRAGHVEIVETLIAAGASVEVGTPLNHASFRGHLDVIKVLLKVMPDGSFDKPDKNDLTPVAYAAMQGHLKVVQHYTEMFCSIDQIVLGLAKRSDNPKVVTYLKQAQVEREQIAQRIHIASMERTRRRLGY